MIYIDGFEDEALTPFFNLDHDRFGPYQSEA
jgi:hypothetical protein